MRRITLHGLDQVRNQIVPLLQLHVDIGKGLVDALPERDQPVICAESEQRENDDDAENDPAGRHGGAPDKTLNADSLASAGNSGEVGIALVARKAARVQWLTPSRG